MNAKTQNAEKAYQGLKDLFPEANVIKLCSLNQSGAKVKVDSVKSTGDFFFKLAVLEENHTVEIKRSGNGLTIIVLEKEENPTYKKGQFVRASDTGRIVECDGIKDTEVEFSGTDHLGEYSVYWAKYCFTQIVKSF